MSSFEEVDNVLDRLNLQDEPRAARRSARRIACNFQRPSSPDASQGQSLKHDLTPKSKSAGLPKSKRTHVSSKQTRCNLEVFYDKEPLAGKVVTLPSKTEHSISGQQVKKRQEQIHTKLLEGFEECCDKEVDQQCVLQYLKIGDDGKSLVTRAVTAAFPSCIIKRVKRNGHNINVYKNITQKVSNPQVLPGINLSSIDVQIVGIREKISVCDTQMDELWSSLTDGIEKNAPTDVVIKVAEQFKTVQENKDKYMAVLVKLYQAQVQIIQNTGLTITAQQKEAIETEMKQFEELSNKGYRSGRFSSEISMPDNLFASFLDEIIEKTERNVKKTATYKLLCASQSLTFLLNIRNSRAMNDFVFLFGMLCISYGAGKQFINMLSAIGLTLHWDTLMSYLDKRLENSKQLIDEKFPVETPVIMLIDNVNMYRGRKRHERLVKMLGPKMWNFTVRAALRPSLHGIEHLFNDVATYTQPQTLITNLEAKDVLLDADPDHVKLWEENKNRYLLNLLDVGLNKVPLCSKPIDKLSDRECNAWIKESLATTSITESSFQIDIPELKREFPLQGKSDYLILPLSLENNSTLTGTAAILEQFGNEFQIPCKHASRHFVFDENEKCYDLISARKHHEFMLMIFNHRKNSLTIDQQLRSTEKTIADDNVDEIDENEVGEDDTDAIPVETIESTKRFFQQQDGKLTKLYNSINNKMLNAMQSGEGEKLNQLIRELQETQETWKNITDHLGRNILHEAVEHNNIPLVKTLLSSGVDINVQEGCGATPLSIAVLNRNTAMCELPLLNFASISGPLFASMPSPTNIADNMKLTDIQDLFQLHNLEDDKIDSIINEGFSHSPDADMETDETDCKNFDENNVTFDRNVHLQCPTAIVGDQGTCKILRSAKNRSQEAFKWVAEIPGDLHTKGYLCEAAYKAQKSGVFLYLVNKIMKRPKVTEEAFRARKFQQQNLSRIQEAVRDGAMAIGLAVVQTFKASEEFPMKEKLDEHLAVFGNHNDLLLKSFKQWFSSCAKRDPSFAYNTQLVDLFSPLLDCTNAVIRNGQGITREAVWKILLPIFAQLQFRNYWTEALVHIVNFTALWPIAFREMVRRNCSISLNGKNGHDLAMDEFVEEHLVKPLKAYVSGHTSVKMCERVMTNIQMIEAIRKAFMSKKAFDVHPTTKHKEQDPFPDQLKGMWFCLRENLTSCVDGRNVIKHYSLSGSTAKEVQLPKKCCNVYEKGCQKVAKEFKGKLHECFPSVRSVGSM